MSEDSQVLDEVVEGEDGVVAEVDDESISAPSPKLVVKRNGAETDEVFWISSPCIIGRFDPTVGPIDVDLGPLPEGVYVSRKHAKITEEDGVWKISDLGSSNGTFVLGDDFEKVEEAEITDGTEIALGNARFVFHVNA
ncbi:MAG TPA: FHA domain-containing protein [Fimbriimonas sp.]|nr:FHA domain-containing protein [Fimbriimonas sp.]